MPTMLDALRNIVGASHVLTAADDTKPYFTDWRRQYSAPAECVVRPGSAGEVARVVALCAREGIAVVPQGGNTGLCGGSVPTGARREIVLSLSRLNRVRGIDPLNDTITVEAGCVLASVQKAASDADRFFPLSLAAEGSCQIGGNLSTNAGGVNVLRYGNAREQVLGLEVVLPDGRLWDGLRGLRKDNTGYDLKQLFLGAEGTLGIITAAVLRLHPKPTASATAWVGVATAQAAVELLAALRGRMGERISAFELISREGLDAVLAYAKETRAPLPHAHPWNVLVEFADNGPAERLREQVEQALGESDAALAHSGEQSRQLWRIRETLPEAQFANVKHDISVPLSDIPGFIARTGEALRGAFPQAEIFCFGHVGDGNLHYNVGPKALMAERARVNEIVYNVVREMGGSISAEHGLGQLKRQDVLVQKSALEMELMRAVKRALDPAGLMNPGKVI
jgi:FAD/FMN-containing dehydrogenase